jgi:hypothetical protein
MLWMLILFLFLDVDFVVVLDVDFVNVVDAVDVLDTVDVFGCR